MVLKIKMMICVCVLCAFAVLPIFGAAGKVILVSGKADVQMNGGWVALKVGDTVNSGTIISTGFRSQVVLQVAKSTITVDSLSRLTLEQLTETGDGHNSEVFLDIGSISANVKAAENKRVGFIVNTPVATASVRGTEFSMTADSVSVRSGTVAVTNNRGNARQKEILVKNGSEVKIEANYIAPPQVTKAAEATAMGGDLPSTEETVGSSSTGGSSSSLGDSVGFETGTISVSIEY